MWTGDERGHSGLEDLILGPELFQIVGDIPFRPGLSLIGIKIIFLK